MEALEKYFDHYVINARLKPAFFVVLPFAITTLAWCPEAQQIGGAILAFLITFGVIAFLSNLVSNLGNQLQDKLFGIWGGAPTTALLRHSDNILDAYTKQRYHKWLESKLPGLMMPSPESEAANPISADNIYASAANFLREYTRNKTKYLMVYSDNVAYGFARNLLVMRPIGIGVALLSIFLNLIFLYVNFIKAEESLRNLIDHKISMVIFGSGAIAVSVILLLIITFTINQAYVQGRAIRYAKSLLAVCEERN
jgi:hypothetical protein